MNSASSGKTFIKMQNQILQDDDAACCLVEVIAKRSQNIKWEPTVDGKRMGHKLIRRVSIDKFYELVTGEQEAFHDMCMVLPKTIKSVVTSMESSLTPHDTVMEELRTWASHINLATEDLSIAMAIYMLGFKGYNGFYE